MLFSLFFNFFRFCFSRWRFDSGLTRENTQKVSFRVAGWINGDLVAIVLDRGGCKKIQEIFSIHHTCNNFMTVVGQLDCSGSMLLASNNAEGLVIKSLACTSKTPFLLFVIENSICFVLEFWCLGGSRALWGIDIDGWLELKGGPRAGEKSFSMCRFQCEMPQN